MRSNTPISRLNQMDLSGLDLSDDAPTDDFVMGEHELAAIDLGDVDFSGDFDAERAGNAPATDADVDGRDEPVLDAEIHLDLAVDLAIDLDPFES